MYIISKQKDYYDGVVGTVGIDKTIVYERVLQEIENKKEYPKTIVELCDGKRGDFFSEQDLNRYHLKKDQKKYVGSCAFIIGFCGKLYVGWKLYRKVKRPRYDYTYDDVVVDYCYDVNEALKYIDGKRGKTNFLQNALDVIANANVIDVFREFNSPVFVYDYEWSESRFIGGNYSQKFVVNPILKEFEFYKVLDTFTTFQEIQMFISGVLGTGEKEIIEVEDKYKIGQHGFDKWSFRREPTKKR
jgi:hypothetical protein